MEQSKGGVLPNGSINITPKTPNLPVENWQPAEPLYGEWVNNGAVYGCSNWTPAPTSMLKDEPYTQTATDCKQDQTTTKQEREQEATTFAFRDIGPLITISKTITVGSSRAATGLASCSYNTTGSNQNYWYSDSRHNFIQPVVNNVVIYSQRDYTVTSITVNGVRYKQGFYKKENYYEICK
ncbi:hypothetical protein G7007_07110 [Pseudomonas entomophila]|uniref:hypothetical protein n=1 Tax=Pseudomonas entomophila TaxID=312306 RepID=UPI0015E2CA98|nr:hypothetical protein [Pseudomonas entomophila]MBA1192630.1 hypothetical protein [Pseudomonas entomophila]